MRAPQLKVLVVDHDEPFCDALQSTFLAVSNAKVVALKDGSQALDLLLQQPMHLALINAGLESLIPGVDLAQAIADNYQDTFVVLMVEPEYLMLTPRRRPPNVDLIIGKMDLAELISNLATSSHPSELLEQLRAHAAHQRSQEHCRL